jgi:putative hemolysin
MNLLLLLIFLACLGLSFLLSGMEAGVFALSRLRIRQQMRAGKPSARVLHGFLENPEDFLWTLLIGNTLANFFILGVVIAWLYQRLGAYHPGFVAALAGVVFVFYVLFDLLPKMLFRLFPNRLCLWWARSFRFIHLALRPLVALVEGISRLILRWTGGKVFTGHLFGNREELRLVMQESAAAFSNEKRAMISRVLDLQSLTVRQVDRPLSEAVVVMRDTPMAEVFGLCSARQLTRLPVCLDRDGRKHVVGIIDLDTLIFRADLDRSQPAGDYVKPALYLEEDLRLEVALQRMRRGGQRLAIVLGRDRQEVGIVTLEDILKVVFGEVKL